MATQKGWAIVTGASGGIGSVFARRLAERGHPLVLVARKREALARLADELRQASAAELEIEIVTADLATPAGVDAVADAAARLGDVELLVNNAGLSTTGHFLEQTLAREQTSIKLNVEALHALTRRILPGLVARKRGGVINVASIVGFQAIPYWTTYAATKAFVLAFTEGLAYEMRNTGVRVLAVCPGFTKTGLYDKTGKPGLAGKILPMSTPESVVKTALRAYDRGRVVKIVGWTNRLLALSGAPTPRPIVRWLMGTMFAPDTPPALPEG